MNHPDRKLYAAFDIQCWEMPTLYQELLTEFEAARARFKKARCQAEREAAVTAAHTHSQLKPRRHLLRVVPKVLAHGHARIAGDGRKGHRPPYLPGDFASLAGGQAPFEGGIRLRPLLSPPSEMEGHFPIISALKRSSAIHQLYPGA